VHTPNEFTSLVAKLNYITYIVSKLKAELAKLSEFTSLIAKLNYISYIVSKLKAELAKLRPN